MDLCKSKTSLVYISNSRLVLNIQQSKPPLEILTSARCGVHICNSNTWDVETGGSGVKSHS